MKPRRRLLSAAATVLAMSTGTAAIATPTRPAAGRQLALELSQTLGWVGAEAQAYPGTPLQLSELVSGRAETLMSLTAPASGRISLAHVSTWRCSPRVRTFWLSATDGSAPPVTATTETPSCRERLRVGRLPHSIRVGRSVRLRLQDRWHLGGFSLHICTVPPAEPASCRPLALRAGRPDATIAKKVDSPGIWELKATSGWGQHVVREVRVAHPSGELTLLATGDSEIQEVDTDVQSDLQPSHVRVDAEARVGTGISKVAQFDWVRHARFQAAKVRPDVTVVFIGANDGFALRDAHGRQQACCGPAWVGLFAARAEQMMRYYLRAGRGRVFWFTLPIARDPRYAALFRAVNRGYLAAAARVGAGVRLIRADRIFTPGGRYHQTLDEHGRQVDVRARDGIHLSPAGAQIAAAAVVAAIRSGRLL